MSDFKIIIKDDNYLQNEHFIKRIWDKLSYKTYKNKLLKREFNNTYITFDINGSMRTTQVLRFLVFNHNNCEIDVENEIVITIVDNIDIIVDYIIHCIENFVEKSLKSQKTENNYGALLERFINEWNPDKLCIYDVNLFAGFMYYRYTDNNTFPTDLDDIVVNAKVLSKIQLNFTLTDIKEYINFRTLMGRKFSSLPLAKSSIARIQTDVVKFYKFSEGYAKKSYLKFQGELIHMTDVAINMQINSNVSDEISSEIKEIFDECALRIKFLCVSNNLTFEGC